MSSRLTVEHWPSENKAQITVTGEYLKVLGYIGHDILNNAALSDFPEELRDEIRDVAEKLQELCPPDEKA
jgi:hypothetical protein